MVDDEYILRVNGLSKRFGGVQALDNVDFDLRYGEIHALVGENGAGKSTLIKVLGGVYSRDSGTVEFEGKEVIFNRPIEAQEAGIAIIYQELSLMSSLNVIENIFMGRMTSRFGIIDWKDLERRTREVLGIIGLDIDPKTILSDLTISQRQMIEIATAIAAIGAGASAYISILYSKKLRLEREKRSIFIVYSREDLDAARQLYKDLKDRGFNPWLDVEEILPGEVWRESVLRALEKSAVAIVLISENLSKKRGFVWKEVKAALEVLQEREPGKSPVIPVRLTDTKVPIRLSHIQWVDLFREDGLDRLETSLKHMTA